MTPNQTEENLLKALATKKKEDSLTRIKDVFLFTVNYKTAPVAIREKFAIPEYSLTESYQNLKKYNSLKSFLLLSTCNRTEIYFKSNDTKASMEDICSFFSKHFNIEEKIIKEYSSILEGDNVINHAYKLSCGLDSLVLGESQVLSQVRNAYSIAQKEQTLDNVLELLFQGTIKCAKEIHKNTNLSKNSQSISSAAIDLANRVCGPLKQKSIMVLGAGNMAKLALEHVLKVGGSKETVVLNRSPHRVIEFSENYKVDKSIPFENVYEGMNDVDIVIVATGAPHFILFAEQFNQVRKDPAKPLYIFDISMPRNIDSEFGKLPNVTLLDIDSLQTIYKEITHTNNEDLKQAEKILSDSINRFYEQISNEPITDLIKELKERVEQIRSEKLLQFISSKDSLTKEEIDYITKNIINTIFHTPIKTLKDSSAYGSQDEKIQLIKDLFGLE